MRYLHLPTWFMVWFVVARSLCGRDSYRLVFKWLQPFRRQGTAGRRLLTTLLSDLRAEIAEEVLPERRHHINPRVIKQKMSNGRKQRPEHRHDPQPTQKFRQSIVMLN